MNRGRNTVEYWEQKHINEYRIDKPYNFESFETRQIGYTTTSADIIMENDITLIIAIIGLVLGIIGLVISIIWNIRQDRRSKILLKFF